MLEEEERRKRKEKRRKKKNSQSTPAKQLVVLGMLAKMGFQLKHGKPLVSGMVTPDTTWSLLSGRATQVSCERTNEGKHVIH